MVWTGGSQGTLAPALVALFKEADRLWPNRSRISDGTLGDTAHASRTSDHNPKAPNPPGWVDAADLTDDKANGCDADLLARHLVASRDPRVKYVIWNGTIVKSYTDSNGVAAWTPQPYTGPNAHEKHTHISVTPEGRADTSPWFPTEETDDMTPEQAKTLDQIAWMVGQIKPNVDRLPEIHLAADRVVWGVLDPAHGLRVMVAELLGRPVAEVDAEMIAAAIPADLASQVADELHKRLAG